MKPKTKSRKFKVFSSRRLAFLKRVSTWQRKQRVRKTFQPAPLEIAQRTRVVHQQQFLSRKQISRLLVAFERLRLQPYTNNPADIDDEGNAVHCTHYVHTDGIFQRKFPGLRQKIFDLAATVFQQEGWGLLGPSRCRRLPRNTRIRCAEYHDMRPGGSLPDMDHYDVGSLVTVDIMLEEPELGAQFQTVEPGGDLLPHDFRVGDALVFNAHKYHRVSRLLRGRRRVLVVELWCGVECVCGHRCDLPEGGCNFRDC
eukprot:TRINITY_DN15241_c0_g2_i1.p1 TRINITY_DN15241_c0_g2~~TRINITY_DN15241_c0_g2_i1.p1  ORF type:complete len:255 (+),score=37.25 TRINITY_DN15241_c0_g2_i1:164-928(+)